MNKERREEREAKAIVEKTLEIEPVEGTRFGSWDHTSLGGASRIAIRMALGWRELGENSANCKAESH
jgi:hypothetical protein